MEQPVLSHPAQQSLRSLWGHLGGSATGAANDNFFRLAFTAAIQRLVPEQAEFLMPLLGLLFILPMLVMAPTAGSLGDRLPARRLMLSVRLSELLLVALGATALIINSIFLMLLVLAGFGLQTAFYSPVKYACMPDLLPAKRLVFGNGLLQASTSLAILGGTALVFLLDPSIRAGSSFEDWGRGSIALLIGGLVALLGILSTACIARIAPHNPQQRIVSPLAMGAQFRALSAQPGLWGPTLALSAFWALGAVGQLVVVAAAMGIFNFDEAGVAVLVVILGLGTAVGGLTADRLVVPAAPRALPSLGALLAGFAFYMACISALQGSGIERMPDASLLQRLNNLSPAFWRFATWLFVTGIGGGWWAVSCNTLLQERSDVETRSMAYSGINLVTNLGLIAGFIALLIAPLLSLSVTQAGALMGLLTGLASLLALYVYRIDLARWCFSWLCHLFWRIRIQGLEQFPQRGGCVVVANHHSFADGPLLVACLPRATRPLVHVQYSTGLLRRLLRAGGCISIDPLGGRSLVAAIAEASQAAQSGSVIVIFAEGKLSRGADLDRFHAGAERIAQRAQAPIIPLRIDGVLGSFLSRSAWRDRWRWRRPVSLRLGPALPSNSSSMDIRQAVHSLAYDHAQAQCLAEQRSLGRACLRLAKQHPWAPALIDAKGHMRRLQLCSSALALQPALRGLPAGARIGLLLAPGRMAMMGVLALSLGGFSILLIDPSTDEEDLRKLIQESKLAGILASPSQTTPQNLGIPVLDLDRACQEVPGWRGLWARLCLLILPCSWLDRSPSQAAALHIFQGGALHTLSHQAVLSHCQASQRHFALSAGQEPLFSAPSLPPSLGLFTTALSLTQGIPLLVLDDPLDDSLPQALQAGHAPQLLIGTPALAATWKKGSQPQAGWPFFLAVHELEMTHSDKAAIEAEGLGYGLTVSGLLIAASVADVHDKDVCECGSKAGSVGRALPGILVRPLSPEDPGQLHIQVPGIAQALRIHGYMDESGFIFLDASR